MTGPALGRFVRLLLLVGAWCTAGCGDDDHGGGDGGDASAPPLDAAVAPDATGIPDAAPLPDVNPACIDPAAAFRGRPDRSTAQPTTDTSLAVACNPVSQTGCGVGEKCAWVVDQLDPEIGHLDCAPAGTVSIGSACTEPTAPGGTDDCEAGGHCYNGYCHELCTTVNDQCGDGACQGFLDDMGHPLPYEICLFGCNPLLQNCAADNEGCYVARGAVCVVSIGTAGAGEPCQYVNACAPGLICMGYPGVCRPFCGPLKDCWEMSGDPPSWTTPTECGCGACAACGADEICWPIGDSTGGVVSEFFGICIEDTALDSCSCGGDPICPP